MWYAYIVFWYALPVNRYVRTITKNREVLMTERKYRHPQVNLRLPEDLKEKVAALASQHGRSANAEMVEAIEAWVTFHNGVDIVGDKTQPPKERMHVDGEDMMRFLNIVKDAVVHQLVQKYKITLKESDGDKDNKS